MVRAGPLGRYSWALFDWANQPYFTLITTFIFAPYFATAFVGDPVAGQSQWGYTQSLAGVVIALLSPALGAVADVTGRRKAWLGGFALIYLPAVSLLWFAEPGASERLPLIMGAVAVASIAIEFSIVFNNAMLPSLIPPARMGQLSGFAWGLGYLGGLLSLVVVLFFLVGNETSGLTMLGIEPLFGLDAAAKEGERLVGPLSGLWYLIFILPLFLFTPDIPHTGIGPLKAIRGGAKQLWGTILHLRSYRQAALYLVARMIYYDGISAIFAFGGIYAAGTFAWDSISLGSFAIILTIFAAIGAFAGGRIDDKVGSKKTVMFALAGIAGGTALAASVTADHVLYIIPVEPPAPERALFGSIGEQVYLGAAILIGIFAGPAQAASRTFLARLAPPAMMTEFFGLYALSGKATAFLAPFAIAVITAAYQSQRAGLVVVVFFLLAGLFLLSFVRDPSRDGYETV